jgi:chromatin remodeling complex protein RSC6
MIKKKTKVSEKKKTEVEPVIEETVVNNSETESNLSMSQTCKDIFESLVAQNENLLETQKLMLSTVKKVAKTYSKYRKDYEKNVARERRKAKKDPNRKKREPSGFAVPTNISSDLCDFLSVPHDTKMSRTDVTRKITKYIRDKNLQVPENRRSFIPDSQLGGILGPLKEVDKEKGYTYFNLQRYITPHITSSAASVTVSSSK